MSWTEVIDDRLIEQGKRYKFQSLFERTSGNTPDSELEVIMMSTATNAEIENAIYRDTGVKVKVENRYATTEKAGKEYSYNVIVKVSEANTPAVLIALAAAAPVLIKWISILLSVFFITDSIKSTQNKAYEEGGVIGGLTNQTMYIVIAVLVIILLLRRK